MAAANGGGVYLGGTVGSTGSINFCTISGNTAGSAGGGIAATSPTSGANTLTVTNSTISGNTATAAAGGGLTLVRATGNVTNCTFSGNRAGFNGGGINVGSTAATLNAINCTITNNSSDIGSTGGGGIRSTGTASAVNLINTLVVGNVLTGTGADDASGTSGTKSAKNSVIGVSTATFSPATLSQIGTSGSPKVVNLGALANNGGPTQTHALLASAPELAINLGSDSDAATFASDQRGVGYNRRAGTAVDIGAFETSVTAPTFTGVTLLGAPASANASNTLTFTVPPGTNRLLLVEASHADSGGVNFTSVTFGASAMTLAGIKTDGISAVDTFWKLPLGTDTKATTATITVTPPAGQEAAHFIAALAFQNVDQTTPTNGFIPTNNAGSGTNPTVDVTSAVGDLVIDIDDLWTASTTVPITRTPGSGQAVAVLANSPITTPPSSYTGIGCYSISLKPGAATTTMSWTASFDAMIQAGLNIKQASAATPTVTVNPTSVALGTTTTGTASTPAQTFTVSGSNLTADIVITAPANVELSKDSGTTWQTPLTLTPSSGTVSTTTIQARIPASASAGSISGVNITCASTGATTQNISVTGTVNNPAPTLSSISPTSVTAGAGNTLLTVTGTNFINGSVINFNGSALTTSFVSSTSLTATIPSASLATAGTPPVTVTTAAPGGGTSSSQTFTINAPAPTITGVNSSATDGSYKAGAVIPITVTFSVPVSVSGAPTLGLNSGGSATYASGTTTNILTFNYTVAALQNSGDLDYNSTSALALAGGTINATTGGTAATLTLPAPGAANSLGANKALVIDTTAPTVTSIVRQTPSGQTTALTTVTFLVTYSEPVLNASTSNFSVVAVNSTIVGTVQSVTGSGNTRAVTVNITSGTGEFRLRALN